jgi:5-deoxy-glucuronate isomerase
VILRAAREFGPGYTPITAIEGSGSDALIDFGLLRLGEGKTYSETSPHERVFLLLHGAALLRWNGGEQRAERSTMLADLPTALHLPGGVGLALEGLAADTEFAVAGAENRTSFAARLIGPSQIRVGEISLPSLEGTADRVLRTVLDDGTAPHSNLAIGEVINQPGRWSSYPPHHHPHPEIYHFRFYPSNGFGYSGHGRDVYAVHDGDTAVIEPGAPHPQVAAPGYTMLYVWVIRHLEGNRFGGQSRIYEAEHTWVMGRAGVKRT